MESDHVKKLEEALRVLKEDYADAEGCYCGQIVGGIDSEGLPKHLCGYCLANAALSESANKAVTA